MLSAEHVWAELRKRGFALEHIQMLYRLLTSARRGSWTIHCSEGKVQQVDVRLLASPHPAALAELEAVLTDGPDGGT